MITVTVSGDFHIASQLRAERWAAPPLRIYYRVHGQSRTRYMLAAERAGTYLLLVPQLLASSLQMIPIQGSSYPDSLVNILGSSLVLPWSNRRGRHLQYLAGTYLDLFPVDWVDAACRGKDGVALSLPPAAAISNTVSDSGSV